MSPRLPSFLVRPRVVRPKCQPGLQPHDFIIALFVLHRTPTYTYFCHRPANLLASKPASMISSLGLFVHGKKHALLEASRPCLWGVPVCPSAYHPLLQIFNAEVATGCFPVLLFCIPFSTLRPVRRTRFTVPGPVYISRGVARFHTPPGCESDLFLVRDLEKSTFAIVPFGARYMAASARSREATRTV